MEILSFTMDNCPPARLVEDAVESLLPEFAADLKKEIKLIKVNVLTQKELASAFQVSAVPAIVALKKEKEVGRLLGFYPREELKTKLKTFLI